MRREQALKIMGFATISKPSESEILKSYRRLALKFDPDQVSLSEKIPNKDIEFIQKIFRKKYADIKAARDFLLSPQGSPSIKFQIPRFSFYTEMRKRRETVQAAQQAFDADLRRGLAAAQAAQQANRRFIKYRINDKEGRIFHSEAAVIELVFGNVIPKYSGVVKRVYIETTNLTSKELFLFSRNIYNGAKESFEALVIDRALIDGMDYADRKGFLELSCDYRLETLKNEANKVNKILRDKVFVRQGLIFSLISISIILAAMFFLYPSTVLNIFTLSSFEISMNIFVKGMIPMGLSIMSMGTPLFEWIVFLLSPFTLVGTSIAAIAAIQHLTGLSYSLLCAFSFTAIMTNLFPFIHPARSREDAAMLYFKAKVRGIDDSLANDNADEAFCLGVESKNWKVYLNSFRPSSPAWGQPAAFSAGLFCSTRQDSGLPQNQEELKKYGNT